MAIEGQRPRALKLADRIQEIVAQTLHVKVKDPRVGFVTITDVRVTGDLQAVTVYYTVLGDEAAYARAAAGLASARGLLRSEVGRQTGLRLTPTLDFERDELPESSQQLDERLAEAARRDAELAALRERATYAGDPNPYRTSGKPDADGEAGPNGSVSAGGQAQGTRPVRIAGPGDAARNVAPRDAG